MSNTIIYDTIKLRLSKITEELNKANTVVATGKRILKLSDDPVGLTQGLNIKSALSNIEQMGRNITLGKSWLAASESAMSQVQDVISEAKTLSVQMANSSIDASERRSAAETVQNLLEELVSLANTEVNGRYIFAGSETDTTSFNLESDNTVTYHGDNNAFTVKIGKDATVEVGSDGEAVFGTLGQPDDVFRAFDELKTALENNDISGIQAAMSDLDSRFDHVASKISDIGSKMLRMEMKENIFQDLDLTNTERLSRIEDADITEAILDLQAKELAYQAALSSASKVLQMSLLDYM
ncbi:MAG: flagellar hook-associated protein FlgL [Deltaproteobacteria bacterium]